MKRVFIDTNILIDFIENRQGADAAEQVLEKGANKEFSIFASPLTFANMAYILGKRFDKDKLYPMLDALEKQIQVLPMDRDQLRQAIDIPSKDFEDMLQYQCALAGNCDVILTRDVKGFSDYSLIPLMTAAEFISSSPPVVSTLAR